MAKVIIESAKSNIIDMIVTLVAGLQDVTGDDTLNLNIVTDPIKGRVRTPQVRYFATAPEDLPNALVTLGEHTIMGLIYKDVAQATIRARETGQRQGLETTRSLAERRHFNQKSLERSLVQLRQAGLVDSERI